MYNIFQIFLIFLSAVTIILADALIKHISHDSFVSAVKHPLFWLILLLYLLQIVMAIFIFIKQGELALYANLFIVFYSILGVVFGVWFYHERLSWVQVIGVALAMCGAMLLNYKH